MSIRARLARLEKHQAAGPQYAGGCLIAEAWYGDVDPPAAAPAGLFRCEALEAEPLAWNDPAAYVYSEAQLEAIAAERRARLILVLRQARAIDSEKG